MKTTSCHTFWSGFQCWWTKWFWVIHEPYRFSPLVTGWFTVCTVLWVASSGWTAGMWHLHLKVEICCVLALLGHSLSTYFPPFWLLFRFFLPCSLIALTSIFHLVFILPLTGGCLRPFRRNLMIVGQIGKMSQSCRQVFLGSVHCMFFLKSVAHFLRHYRETNPYNH